MAGKTAILMVIDVIAIRPSITILAISAAKAARKSDLFGILID